MMPRARAFTPVFAILLTTAILAGLLVLRSASRDLGFSPDSVSYFTMAEGIAAGKGFVDVRRYDSPAEPTYPPGYPILLAAAGLVHGDLMASIPLLHALLFAAAAALLAGGLGAATGSRLLMATGAILFLASGDTIKLYSKVWSETAFVVATLLFIMLLARHLERPGWRILSATALVAGSAALIRYPGVAALAGGCSILLLRRVSIKRRFQETIFFGAIGSIPLGLWLARNVVVFGRPFLAKERGPSDFAFSSRNLELGFETVLGWSGDPAGSYLLCLALIFAGLALRPARPPSPQPSPPGSRGERGQEGDGPIEPGSRGERGQEGDGLFSSSALLQSAAAFSVPYIAVMLIGTFAYGLHKPLDSRALSPIFAPLLLTILLGGHWLTQLAQRGISARWRSYYRLGGAIAAFAFLALLAVAGRHAYLASDPVKAYGILQKRPRAVVEAFKSIEPTGTVFTNIDDSLYLLTGKQCLRLPQVYSLDSRDIRLPDYDEKMNELEASLGASGMIVYYSPSKRLYLPSEQELLDRLSLEIVRRAADGTIYRIKAPGSPRGRD